MLADISKPLLEEGFFLTLLGAEVPDAAVLRLSGICSRTAMLGAKRCL
jgi:hypothetical protein